MLARLINIIGEKHGRLTAIEISHCNKGNTYWLCKCDCGNKTKATIGALRSGNTKSCGCIHKEVLKITISNNRTHGKTNTRLYKIWDGMRQRCSNLNNKDFKRYGSRGITVCDEWDESFECFYDWAMSNGYEDNLTIDRKNVNGNYEPYNCRWFTAKQQGNNRRTNKTLIHNGKEMNMVEWANYTKIPYGTLKQRIYNGWTIERALTPGYVKNDPITYKGETMSANEWSIKLGVKYKTFMMRVQRGWDMKRIVNTPPRMTKSDAVGN